MPRSHNPVLRHPGKVVPLEFRVQIPVLALSISKKLKSIASLISSIKVSLLEKFSTRGLSSLKSYNWYATRILDYDDDTV